MPYREIPSYDTISQTDEWDSENYLHEIADDFYDHDCDEDDNCEELFDQYLRENYDYWKNEVENSDLIYRGIAISIPFNKYVASLKIGDKIGTSWTSNREIAENFASHSGYAMKHAGAIISSENGAIFEASRNKNAIDIPYSFGRTLNTYRKIGEWESEILLENDKVFVDRICDIKTNECDELENFWFTND